MITNMCFSIKRCTDDFDKDNLPGVTLATGFPAELVRNGTWVGAR